jgi:hypothetical protein
LDTSFNQEALGNFENEENELSSSDEDEPGTPQLRKEKRARAQTGFKPPVNEDFQNEKFVFSTRSSNLEKFQNLKNQKELELLINKFWELDIEGRLEIIDNLDSIMTLVSSNELDNIIFSLFGEKEDHLSKSVVNNFYTEDSISGENFASEISGKRGFNLYRNSITQADRQNNSKNSSLNSSKNSNLKDKKQEKRRVLNLMKADRKTKVTKQERLRKVRFSLQDFIFKENKLRKKMLRTFPLILQKIYRTRNESFIKKQQNLQHRKFISPKPKNNSFNESISKNINRFSIRGSFQAIPEVPKRTRGPTITLKRLSNKKMLQDNLKMFAFRDSDLGGLNYVDENSDDGSIYSVEPVVEYDEEVRLLRTMLGFVLRRYKEHKEIKNIILCFESMRQIFSFCPKKIFHLVGLETIIDLLYNHLEKKGESLDLDKKVLFFVLLN